MGDPPLHTRPGYHPEDTLDATSVLAQGHQHLRRLLEELAAATAERAYDRKKAIFRALKAALHVHARLEEDVFYPAVMKLRSAAARVQVKEALEEYQAVDSILTEIDQIEPDQGEYDTKLAVLRASIEHHIGEEERAMFAEARNHLTDDRLQALGRQMLSLKTSFPSTTE